MLEGETFTDFSYLNMVVLVQASILYLCFTIISVWCCGMTEGEDLIKY